MIILGDSHTAAIMEGAAEVDPTIKGGMLAGAARFLEPIYKTEPELQFLGDDIAKLHRRLIGGPIGFAGPFVFSAGLTSNVFLGPLARQRFSLNATQSMACAMSCSLLEDMIKDTQTPIIEFYEELLSRNLLQAVISGPPPQEHHVASKFYGAELFDLMRLHQAPVREALAGRCPIVEVQNITNEHGYFLPQYRGSDPSHGNAAYGALIVRAVLETLG